MSINGTGAIVAGVIGTLVMSLALAGTPRMGMPEIDLVGLLGTMLDPRGNRGQGWMLHLLFGIVFAFLYAAVWSVGIGVPDVTVGLLFGIVHWLVAGFFLGYFATIHAGIRAGTTKDPGRYLLKLDGNMGFFGGLMSHIIFGLTVALVYGFFTMLAH